MEKYRYFNSIKEHLEKEAKIVMNEIRFAFRELRKENRDNSIDSLFGYSKRDLKKRV